MYLFLYIYLIVSYLFLSQCRNEIFARKLYIYIITGILGFCTAFRNYAVGNDTFAYYDSFINSSNKVSEGFFSIFKSVFFANTSDQNKDPGFLLLEKFFYNISFGSFEFYQLIIGLLILIPIGYIIYRYVSNFSTYVICYAFYISLFYHFLPNSATRQTIALGFYFLAFLFWIKKEKIFIPLFLLIVGALIHKSVLICILPFLLMNVKNKQYIVLGTILLSAYFIMNGRVIALWMGELVKSETYTAYAQSDFYEGSSRPLGFIIQMYIYFLLSMMGKIRLNDMKKEYQWFYINFCIAVVLCPLVLVNPSLIRLSSYFSIWGIFFLPMIVQNSSFNSKYRLIVYWILLFLTLGRPLLNPDNTYRFKWQYMELHERYN